MWWDAEIESVQDKLVHRDKVLPDIMAVKWVRNYGLIYVQGRGLYFGRDYLESCRPGVRVPLVSHRLLGGTCNTKTAR